MLILQPVLLIRDVHPGSEFFNPDPDLVSDAFADANPACCRIRVSTQSSWIRIRPVRCSNFYIFKYKYTNTIDHYRSEKI
jgi:hypothetical protein